MLEAPFIASKVRFFPYAAHPRTACMRVELYGCRWKRRYNRDKVYNCLRVPGYAKRLSLCNCLSFCYLANCMCKAMEVRLEAVYLHYAICAEDIVAYSAPKGGDMQAMTGGARFEDLAYDGTPREGRLINGLGQMTDSLVGPNDFELPDQLDTRGMLM